MLRLARDTAALSANEDRSIVCIYLTGSVVTEDPFIGGTTDIDLFFVHSSEPVVNREIRYLSDDVTIDIAHIDQRRFQQPRHLRADAWLGPFLCAKPKVLYDTHHWFEFTEASVAAQFYRPEYVLERARPLASAARQTWMKYHLSQPSVSPISVFTYLQALENAGNSLALLSGPPLPLRRFFSVLPERLEKAGCSHLETDFESFILPASINDLEWTDWIIRWEPVFKEIYEKSEVPVSLYLPRKSYYTKAVTALSEKSPAGAAWLLINSWTDAAKYLETPSKLLDDWREAIASFLQISDSFSPVLEKMDSLLDSVEETLDTFASQNGLSE